MLEDDLRSRHLAHDARPHPDRIIRDLVDAVEHAEGDIAVAQHRQLGGPQIGDGFHRDQARQIVDLFRKQMPNRWRNENGIREHIVHGLHARAGRVSEAGGLDRGRLPREALQPVAGCVARNVDQDVDIVGLNAIGEFVVRKLPGVDPDVRQLLEPGGVLVLSRPAIIADDLKSGVIMMAATPAEG